MMTSGLFTDIPGVTLTHVSMVIGASVQVDNGSGWVSGHNGAPGATGGGTTQPGGDHLGAGAPTGAGTTPGASGTVAAPPPGGGPAATAQPQSPWSIFLLPLLLIFIFLIWTSGSSQRKERKRRDSLLSSLKRHDRVQTIGGIIGSVVEIKDHEVVVKVDEANNIKMRFAKSAIQQVISESNDIGDTADSLNST